MKHKDSLRHTLKNLLSGAAAGAIAMYFSDPDRGRRRRALTRDKLVSMKTKTSDAINVTSRDLSNRLQGIRAETQRRFTRGKGQASDYVLVERVRAKIGRVVSHPHAVKVRAQQGRIILSGAILAHEKAPLLKVVHAVPGVKEVDDALEVHQTADISSLQGEGRRKAAGAAILRHKWPPGLRAVAAAGGSVLGWYAMRRRTPLSMALGAVGIGMITRSMANTPLSSLPEDWERGVTVDMKKAIYIDASPQEVFDLWSDYENFPQFMSHVQEVRDLGKGRSHWTVHGPAGRVMEWDAELTESKRPEALAWKSMPNATVQNEGRIRFEPANGGTRVSVHLRYSPPAGIFGHAAAMLLNGDAKKQMDDDLLRMKAFIESGRLPHDASAMRSTETSRLLH